MSTEPSKATLRAVALLATIHPKHNRPYTMSEAARKCKVARSTIYRHLKKTGARKAASEAAK